MSNGWRWGTSNALKDKLRVSRWLRVAMAKVRDSKDPASNAWFMIGLFAKIGARGLSFKELKKKLRKVYVSGGQL